MRRNQIFFYVRPDSDELQENNKIIFTSREQLEFLKQKFKEFTEFVGIYPKGNKHAKHFADLLELSLSSKINFLKDYFPDTKDITQDIAMQRMNGTSLYLEIKTFTKIPEETGGEPLIIGGETWGMFFSRN